MPAPAYIRPASLLLLLACACGSTAAPGPVNMEVGRDARATPDGGAPAPAADALDAPAPGGDPCAQVRCDSPPASSCAGDALKNYYAMGGVCSPRFPTQDCPRGCQDGACITHVCTPGSAVFTSDVPDVASLATVGPLPALAGGAGYEIRSYMQV